MTDEMDQRFRSAGAVHARRFDDSTVVLDLTRGEYFSLNEVGSAIWEGLSAGRSVGEVAGRLVEEYDVDLPTARRDVQALVARLLASGLLEQSD
jgi:hypothetical protein